MWGGVCVHWGSACESVSLCVSASVSGSRAVRMGAGQCTSRPAFTASLQGVVVAHMGCINLVDEAAVHASGDVFSKPSPDPKTLP